MKRIKNCQGLSLSQSVVFICISILTSITLLGDSFWLTSKGAGGILGEKGLCIKTSDYDIYYSLLPLGGDLTDSEFQYYQSIRSIRPVKKNADRICSF